MPASELNDVTGNYQMFFREYDPVLGRMSGVDIMADKYASHTPYNYGFNDPVYWNDPSGADPVNDKKFGSGNRGYQDAHAGADGMYGSSWEVDTYGDGGPEGDWSSNGSYYATSRLGVGSRNGSYFHQQNIGSIRAKYQRRGRLLSLLTQALDMTGEDQGGVYNIHNGQVANWFTFEFSLPSQLVLSPYELTAGPNSNPQWVTQILTRIKSDAFLMLRIFLNVPDAIAINGNINLIAGVAGTDLTYGENASILKVLTGDDAGQTTSFYEIPYAVGMDASVGVTFTQFYYVPSGNDPLKISNFQGFRVSV